MRRARHGWVIAMLGLGACAAGGGVRAAWVDADGRPAPAKAVEASREACIDQVDAEMSGSRRSFDHIVWGRAMRECMRARGLVLVELPELEVD